MYNITISLNGRIPSKKNNKTVNIKRVNGKRIGIPRSSKAYYKWHNEALKQLQEMNVPENKIPAVKELELTIYFPDKHQADLTNKAESVMDTLVDHGFIEDDKWQVCPRIILQAEYRKNLGGFKAVFKIRGFGAKEDYVSVDNSGIADEDCVKADDLHKEINSFENFDL